MKKPTVVYSVWMIAHPRCFSDVSCIYPNGELNEARVRYFTQVAKACGASGVRILPWLVDDPVLGHNTAMAELNYLPWKMDLTAGRFDLRQKNSMYFSNYRRTVEILNEYGLTAIVSMHDRCHGNNPGRIKHSPWYFNINGINSIFQKEALPFVEEYENDLLDALAGLDIMVEFFNEPDNVANPVFIPFCKRLQEKLLKRGFKRNQLISGIRFFHHGKINPNYPGWKKGIGFIDSLGKEGGPDASFCSLHDFWNQSKFADVYNAIIHNRLFNMCFDGNIITERETKKCMIEFFSWKDPKKSKALRFIYEWLYQGAGTEKYGARGIADAIKEYFGYYPGPTPVRDIQLIDPGNAQPPPLPPKPEPIPPTPTPQPIPTPTPASVKPRKRFWQEKNFWIVAGVTAIQLALVHFVPWWGKILIVLSPHALWRFGIIRK